MTNTSRPSVMRRRTRSVWTSIVLALLAAGNACASVEKPSHTEQLSRCDTHGDCTAQGIDTPCTVGECHPAAAVDAGTEAAVTGTEPLLGACVSAIPAPGWPAQIVTSLRELCMAIGALGVPCPENRAAHLAGVPEGCVPDGRFPTLRRWCQVDEVAFRSNDLAVIFYFDVATGALQGVRVTDYEGQLPCGAGPRGYAGGDVRPRYTTCSASSASCRLCVQEPDECPPDVSAEIPSVPCASWSPAPAEMCECPDAEDAIRGLPRSGQSCERPSDCGSCQNGTCWSDCRCMRDGSYRWLTQCTE